MLKRSLLAASFILLCSGSYAQTMAAKPAGQGTAGGAHFSLTSKDSVFDFCMIEEDAVVKHEFLFQNTGDAPLIISNITSDVAHAKFRWPSRMIKPGKTGIIRVTYTSFMDAGNIAGDIMITSNASDKPMPALHIKGKVVACCEAMAEPMGKVKE